MADFYTHVTTSSVLGVGYAGMGMMSGLSIETSIVAGGLCGVSGMLPDLDSDSGIPIREATGFAAGIIPMLLVERFRSFEMPHDRMVLIAACMYFFIRFVGASLLGRFSVHRGMFHSVPAALIFAGIAFLICGPADDHIRYFKAGAVFFGFMSHLFLDEIYSIEWKGGGWRVKKSFGTAIKLWGKNGWANFSTYAKLAVVGVMVAGEPSVMLALEERYPRIAGPAQRLHDAQASLLGTVREGVAAGEALLQSRGPLAAQGTDPPTPLNVVTATIDPPSPQPMWNPTVPWNQTPVAPSSQPIQSQPAAFPPASEGFLPNSGQPSMGRADAVYSAGGGFAPR
jgi:hypothetical protein